MVSVAPVGLRPSCRGLLPGDGLGRAGGDGVDHLRRFATAMPCDQPLEVRGVELVGRTRRQ